MTESKRRKSKLDPYVEKIGLLPDRLIAELAGVTPENVRAFRKRRGIAARWRGEGEPRPNEQAIMAEAGVTTSHRRSRMRRRAARTAVAGTRASVSVLDAVRVVKGFSVSVRVDDEDQEFVVVGADIAQAAAQAIDSLASRGIEGHVRRICYLADALTN